MTNIKKNKIVIVVLQNPREKILGVLQKIGQAGIFVRGINLHSFEDFVKSVIDNEPFYGLGEHFFPMWRVEKITKDEADGDIPSIHEQFKNRTGMKINDF